MKSKHATRTITGISEGAGCFGTDEVICFDAAPAALDDAQKASPIVHDVGEIFDVSGFASPRPPLVLGPAPLSHLSDGLRISSLPLKFPGSGDRLPAELDSLQAIVEQAASFEHAINPRVERYSCYLTVQQTTVTAGETQRGAAIHSDGIQGPRIQPKQPIERGYLVVDRVPPRFFVQGYEMTGVDPDRHLLDRIFETQSRDDAAVLVPAKTLVLFDSYCVHQALPAQDPGPCAFLRLAYSTRQYDRLGNSVNAAFDEAYRLHSWRFEPRPLPELAEPLVEASGQRLRKVEPSRVQVGEHPDHVDLDP